MYEENPTEIDFASSECEFQVSKGTSYQELTAAEKSIFDHHIFHLFSWVHKINDTYNVYISLNKP